MLSNKQRSCRAIRNVRLFRVFDPPSPPTAYEEAHLWFEIVYDWLNFQLSIVLIVLPH